MPDFRWKETVIGIAVGAVAASAVVTRPRDPDPIAIGNPTGAPAPPPKAQDELSLVATVRSKCSFSNLGYIGYLDATVPLQVEKKRFSNTGETFKEVELELFSISCSLIPRKEDGEECYGARGRFKDGKLDSLVPMTDYSGWQPRFARRTGPQFEIRSVWKPKYSEWIQTKLVWVDLIKGTFRYYSETKVGQQVTATERGEGRCQAEYKPVDVTTLEGLRQGE